MSASAILKLQAAGFSAEQVTALAEVIDSQASSKVDLMEVKAELKADIAASKIDLMDVQSELKADISASKIDMIKWMVGLLLAQTGLLLGGLKLFLH